MTLLNLNRGQRSRLHTAMLAALDVPVGDAMTITDKQNQAYCETACWAEHPGDVINLAEAIDYHIVEKLFGVDEQFVTVDAEALRAELGVETVKLAMRLCGLHLKARVSGPDPAWTDAPANEPTLNEPTLQVTLPANLLETWNSE
ncbi:MAG TPA: hypothetical protein DIT67_00600 [Octadecabacter sp.]|nr:hypothetical protein [Octadecabacter sp.]